MKWLFKIKGLETKIEIYLKAIRLSPPLARAKQPSPKKWSLEDMFRGSEFASSFAQVRIGGKPGQMASADSGVEEERDIDAAGDNGKNPLLPETAQGDDPKWPGLLIMTSIMHAFAGRQSNLGGRSITNSEILLSGGEFCLLNPQPVRTTSCPLWIIPAISLPLPLASTYQEVPLGLVECMAPTDWTWT